MLLINSKNDKAILIEGVSLEKSEDSRGARVLAITKSGKAYVMSDWVTYERAVMIFDEITNAWRRHKGTYTIHA